MRAATVRYHYASLNAMISGLIRDGRLLDARKLFDDNPHRRDTVTWNYMMAGYVRLGLLGHAEALFDDMPQRDAVSWNTMLMGFRHVGDLERVHRYFLQMGRAGMRPTGFTLTTVISAVPPESRVLAPQLHGVAIRSALSSNTFVGTALLGSYANLKEPVTLRRAFDEIPGKNVVSWTSLISGYMEMGCVAEAGRAFDAMPVKNTVAWTVMVNGYINGGDLEEARRCFDRMPTRNVVSWTSMIKGYERKGQFADALDLFVAMTRSSGVLPNQFTYSAVLGACAGCSSLLFGKLVHMRILKSGSPADVVLLSSLVEMYAKCGHVNAAIRVFDSIETKNLVSWNSIIGCCARHGLCARALEEFDRMKEAGVGPDHISFVCVLTACVHGGLVEEGERHFRTMEREFGIGARMEHYACMADLFGRAGQLERAETLIRAMPFEPDIVVWGALISACGLHSSLEHGLSAAESMRKLEQYHLAIHSMLLRVHGDRGAWGRVQELKETMEVVGARKQKGASWVESSFLGSVWN